MPRQTRAEIALAEHATSVALTRDDRTCYRKGCDSPGDVRFLHNTLHLDTKAEADGRFAWWRLGAVS
jgi:hypothetical protein